MKKKNPVIRTYLCRAAASAKCPRRMKRILLAELRQRLAAFRYSDCTMEELCAEFGAPEEIAEDFLKEESILLLTLRTRLLRRTNVILWVIVSILGLFLAYMLYVLIATAAIDIVLSYEGHL